MDYRVDYLTEREAAAIRCNYAWPDSVRYNAHDMTLSFPTGDGVVTIPERTVARFVSDWRRSGAWSLKGAPTPPPPSPDTKPSQG